MSSILTYIASLQQPPLCQPVYLFLKAIYKQKIGNNLEKNSIDLYMIANYYCV